MSDSAAHRLVGVDENGHEVTSQWHPDEATVQNWRTTWLVTGITNIRVEESER